MAHFNLTFENSPEPGRLLPMIEMLFRFTGSLAWPAVVVILVLKFRGPIERLLRAVAKRLRDKNTDFNVGPGGVSLSHHQEATDGRLETIRVQEQIRSASDTLLVPAEVGQSRVAVDAAAGIDPIQLVLKEAEKYERGSFANDAHERGKQRSELADRMGILIRTYGLRDRLTPPGHGATEKDRVPFNALSAGLASSIILGPREGDGNVLLSIARRATFKHAQYRVALAVIQMAVEPGYLSIKEKNAFAAMINQYRAAQLAEISPDKALLRVLRRTLLVMRAWKAHN